MASSVLAIRRCFLISVMLFPCISTGQDNSSHLPVNSSGVRDDAEETTITNRETLSEEFFGRSAHSLIESDTSVHSANAWLDDIRKLSVESTGNSSEISLPHPYILAVWRQMATEDGDIPKLGPGLQSVVSIRAEHGDTAPSETAGVSMLFDLTDVYLDGDTPVAVAQFILYKKVPYWEQLNLSAQDHLEVRISVCHGESVEFPTSQSSSCIHTYSRTLSATQDDPEVFNITDATRSLLREKSPSMQLHLTAWIFSANSRSQARLELFFVFQNQQKDPLLILYRNMEPPVMFGRLPNTRLKREKRQRRNAIQASGQNMDCRLHEWEVYFSVMQWTWVEQPKHYQANFCSGNCPTPLADKHYNSTNHAYVKNVFNMETNWRNHAIPRACCVPTHFRSLSMLYREGTAFVLKNMPEMIAQACACM